MQPLRRAAWLPLGVSLGVHLLFVALWWHHAAPAPVPTAAPARTTTMTWLRLVPPATTPAAPAATATSPATLVRKPAARPPARPARAEPSTAPIPVPAAEPAVAVAEVAPAHAAPAAPNPPTAVTGVAFGPMAFATPFAGGGGRGWSARAAPNAGSTRTTAQPSPPPSIAPSPADDQRRQLLEALTRQVAAWSAPVDLAAAECRVRTAPNTGDANDTQGSPSCNPPALADSLATPLGALRDAWVAYRRLTPDAPDTVTVAWAAGRYELRLTP